MQPFSEMFYPRPLRELNLSWDVMSRDGSAVIEILTLTFYSVFYYSLQAFREVEPLRFDIRATIVS